MNSPGQPPEVGGEWVSVSQGGSSQSWFPLKIEKHFTNAFIWDKKNARILLGLKKRGFGVNKWNGFGGKVEESETPLQAAKRELKEEAGIDAALDECGMLIFYNEDTPFCYMIHIFRAQEWDGEPSESEEMRPKWFELPAKQDEFMEVAQLTAIPFDAMWPDDELWFPLLLSEAEFIGRVDFSGLKSDGTGGDMRKWWFGRKT